MHENRESDLAVAGHVVRITEVTPHVRDLVPDTRPNIPDLCLNTFGRALILLWHCYLDDAGLEMRIRTFECGSQSFAEIVNIGAVIICSL